MLHVSKDQLHEGPGESVEISRIINALSEVPFGLVVVDTRQNVLFATQLARIARIRDGDDDIVGMPFSEVFEGFSGPTGSVATRSNRTGDFIWTPMPGHGWTGIFAIDEREERMPGVAQTDELTGLGNRAFLRTAVAAAIGAPDGRQPALISLDLDRFKDVNDTLGHGAGDALLIKVADRLRRIVRTSDVVVRIGGDEFTILLADGVTETSAEEVARRIVDTISRPYLIDGHQVTIGASVGLSFLEDEPEILEQAMRRADIALYAAKHAGRGQFRWFEDTMQRELELRQAIISEIRKGILLDEFEMYFQPQFSMTDRTICAVEALVRWNHPNRGLLAPAAFLSLAEESGQIIALGNWTLDAACNAARDWTGDVPVSVNISASHFRSDGFVASVAAALETSGLPPHRLELEIKGSVFATDTPGEDSVIAALRTIGVRIALDEFGSGSANLARLRTTGVDRLKLDHALLPTGPEDRVGAALFDVATGIGNALNAEVTASRVETEEQMQSVARTSATAAQGFLLANPLTASEIRTLIASASTGRGPGND